MSTTLTTGGSLRIVSWNVRGTLDKIKRGAILKFAKRAHADVLLLQETHLMGTKALCFQRFGYTQVFHSGFVRGSRGVAILVHHRAFFIHTKTWHDTQGRYLFVYGTINGEPLVLGSVYAPPPLSWGLVEILIALWTDLPDSPTVVGGDWNDVLDVVRDRWRRGGPPESCPPTKLCSLTKGLGWVDSWRLIHGATQGYTYISAPHESFSRLDYLFVSRGMEGRVAAADILPRGLSDHSPVALTLHAGVARGRFQWRLSTWSLHQPDYQEHMAGTITQYLMHNVGSVRGVDSLWEAMKPTLRGVDISYCAAARKARRESLIQAEASILVLEERGRGGEGQQARHQLLLAQQTYSHLLLEEARQAWLATRSRIYQWGDKSSKLLHRLCQGTRGSPALPGILGTDGQRIRNPSAIADSFAQYYATLYAPGEAQTPAMIGRFLDDLPPKTLSDALREQLEAPLSQEELCAALGELQPGKAPGPNGFPSEFFKQYFLQLGPHYHQVVEASRERGFLPDDWRHADIVVFQKPGRPPESHKSYRPILLLNVEAKILAKVLANRLRPHISLLVHPDQAGFMPQRATRHNIRRAHVAVAVAERLGVHAALLLADMDRAFESLSWEYLFALLRRLNMGPRFLSYITLLYTDITASVRVAGATSPVFSIGRGTRQGCPLSPYLFALAMEPLAAWVRMDAQVAGLEWAEGLSDRIALYADDVLFFLTDIDKTGPRLLRIMQVFGETSGLYMNPLKSTLWILGQGARPGAWASSVQVVYDGVKYLGVFLSNSQAVSWDRNLESVWTRVRADLKVWSHMPLTIYGRSAIFKMVSLPRLLYHLQNYPYFIPRSWFRRLNSALGQFLWGGRAARVALRTCFQSTYCGGLATSDILSYYMATQLLVLNEWWYGDRSDPAYGVERYEMGNHTLHTLLYSAPLRRPLPPATRVIFQVWRQALRRIGWWGRLTRETPLWHNGRLPQLAALQGFRGWDVVGISTLGDVMRGAVLKSFQDLQTDFQMPKTQFFKYLQFRHALSPSLEGLTVLAEFSPIEAKVFMGDLQDRKISKIYHTLVTHSSPSLQHLRETWEGDVGPLEGEDWVEALASPRGQLSRLILGSSSSSTSIGYILQGPGCGGRA